MLKRDLGEMALIRCEECQQTVSDKAASCPHCGAPQGWQANPPALPPLLQADAKKVPSKKRTGCVVTGLVLFILFLIAMNSGGKETPKQQAAVSGTDRAAIAKNEALEAAKKQEEEARCHANLQCLGDKKSIEAKFKCVPYVERLAKNNYEWVDKWYESKFSRFRWKDQKNLVITYIGDKIKYQNGFGAWVLSIYECDYNVSTQTVIDVRASPGRLPE
jgi:hypothetical protein